MMADLYGLITRNLPAELALFMVMVGVPMLLGLLVTWGRWKLVLKAYAFWVAGLLGVWWTLTDGDFNDTMHGFMLFFMFFSVIGVPVVALIMNTWDAVQRRKTV